MLNNGINLVRIFSPEHGYLGNYAAGKYVDNNIDFLSGSEVISLYGKNKAPMDKYLADIDILIFDIQDIGVRYYTYASTMTLAMEKAAQNNVDFMILDRPNPLTESVQGAILDLEFSSFVGMHSIPIRHGMTIAEFALFIKENKDNLYSIDILTKIIEWCCRIKTNIIIEDEKDNGVRNKLNFGHTIGHAIESIYNIRHGEAVAYGMLCAAYLSKGNNTLDNNQFNEIVTLINYFDLPEIVFDIKKILKQISKDKKRINGKNNIILLNSIGNSYISDNIEINLIKNSISNL